MKIAYLVAAPGIPVAGPSGASAHVRGLVRGWRARGHAVSLYAARETDRRGRFGPEVEATITGVCGWPSWLRSWRELAEIRTSRRLSRRVIEDMLAERNPDLVVERHSLWSDAAARVGDHLGVPWALEVNAPQVLERARYERLGLPGLATRWEREVLRAAPVVFAVSQWLVDWLSQEIGNKNAVKIWNGVEPLVGDRAVGRARLGVAEGAPVIGFVGSMKPWHGVERLEQVARAVGAKLALIGRVPASAPTDALLPGALDPQALADVVAALDVGLAPYPADAPPWFCPMKVLDYRAQGTPVVGTDIGETAALVGEGGTVVPAHDDDAMIDAVRHWLGRRTVPWVRSWEGVGEEIIAGAARDGFTPTHWENVSAP